MSEIKQGLIEILSKNVLTKETEKVLQSMLNKLKQDNSTASSSEQAGRPTNSSPAEAQKYKHDDQ